MERAAETDEAIDRLVLSGVLAADEAVRLRARVPQAEAEGPPQQAAGDRWQIAPRPDSFGEERPTLFAEWQRASAVDAEAAVPAEPDEPFAAAALRIWSTLRGARRAFRSPRFLGRLSVVAATLLVVLFWMWVALALLEPIPQPLRPFVLLLLAGTLAAAGHLRGKHAGDAWTLLADASSLVAALTALHAAPWAAPYPWVVIPLVAAVVSFVGTRDRRGLGLFLPAMSLLAFAWATVLVTGRYDVLGAPVYVTMALLFLVIGAISALPDVQSPSRRRYAWWPRPREPLAVACASGLVWVLPRALGALQVADPLPVASILLVLLTVFLYGIRVRSLLAVSFALTAPLVLIVYGILVLMGPLGWLLLGFALGALIVWSRLRRRTAHTEGRADRTAAEAQREPVA